MEGDAFDCDPQSGWPCRAAILNLGAAGNPETIAVLRIYQSEFNPPFRYLVFSRLEGVETWRIIGTIDFEGGESWYYAPEPRLQSLGPVEWLVFKYVGEKGTGIVSTTERWYGINKDSLEAALSLSIEGRMAWEPYGPGRTWRSHVVEYQRKGNDEFIRVQLEVQYFVDSQPPLTLGSRKRLAVYTRHLGQTAFQLDSGASDIATEELEQIFGAHHVDWDAALLKYDFAELRKVATGPQSQQLRWLKNFLSRCPDTEEKLALAALLKGKR